MLSLLAEARNLAIGAERHCIHQRRRGLRGSHRPACRWSGPTTSPSCRRFPKPTSCRRAERHSIHRGPMAFEGPPTCSAGRVPRPHRLVVASRSQQLAIRAERHSIRHGPMALEGVTDLFAAGRSPTTSPSCRRFRSQQLAVRAERHPIHRGRWHSSESPTCLPLVGPQSHRLVGAGGGEGLAVGLNHHPYTRVHHGP